MKLAFSQSDIITTAKSLGLPTDGFVQRRVARAIDILDSNKVSQIDDGIFRVRSQYDPDKAYIVNVNSGDPSCDCPDSQQRTIHCKHRISALLYMQRQAKALTIYDDTENSYLGRGRWIVADHKARVKYIIYRDKYGRLHCPCNPKNADCIHKKAINDYLGNNDGGNGNGRQHALTSITNDCGTDQAKALQDKLNGQLNRKATKVHQNNKLSSAFETRLFGNGGNQSPSQQPQSRLNRDDPFCECEQLDIDQIEGRGNGDLAHKLSNGEVVISYKGIMKLAEKHNISFSVSLHDDTNTVIAKAMNGNSRISGKEVKICGKAYTASELAKRNAARQLIPLPEIKAIEKKVQLENEFDWQKAKAKCVELVGIEANVDIIIHELVKDGKLRQDNPSHYDRTEWLIIHDACKQDASNNNNDGGDNPPSSLLADGTAANDEWKVKLQECKKQRTTSSYRKDTALNETRFDWLKSDLQCEGAIPKGHPSDWQDREFETLKQACALDTSLFNRALGDDFHIQKERNWGGYELSRRYRFWIVTKDTNELREKCFVCGKTKSQAQMTDDLIHWERYYIKTVVCADCLKATTKADLTRRFDELYKASPGAVNTDGLPKPSEDFINQIDSVLNKRGGNATPSERTPNNADDFVSECKEAVDNVNDDDSARSNARLRLSVEANEQPLEGDNGKRKLQMDKKLRTWLVETDGTKKEISCREICERFESEKNPNIVTRLRVGIDSGADISIVELDD